MVYGSGWVNGAYSEPESVVSVFWPQYDEHGWGLRKQGGGGGYWVG